MFDRGRDTEKRRCHDMKCDTGPAYCLW